MKDFFVLTVLSILFIFPSCSEDEGIVDHNLPNSGPLIGSFVLMDKFENEDFDYSDLQIELIDSLGGLITISPDSLGFFRVEFPIGIVVVNVDKPGYVGINSISFNNTENIDSISPILLTEEMPFEFSILDFDFIDGFLEVNVTADIESPNEDYLVGHFLCFSKDPDVDVNNNLWARGTGGFININYISPTLLEKINSSIYQFEYYGFNVGDQVYVMDYAVAKDFYTGYPAPNFEILSYKLENPSNVVSFILL